MNIKVIKPYRNSLVLAHVSMSMSVYLCYGQSEGHGVLQGVLVEGGVEGGEGEGQDGGDQVDSVNNCQLEEKPVQ